ncbi:MAG: hypothetical protein Q4G27_09895 [Flavobacteriaceae bacterium]|nr:hypothetical protein [Flavobacteriaceae bacterium]
MDELKKEFADYHLTVLELVNSDQAKDLYVLGFQLLDENLRHHWSHMEKVYVEYGKVGSNEGLVIAFKSEIG